MRELTERESIRIRAQTKQAQLKAEAIDILIDALHRQTRGGATGKNHRTGEDPDP
jgi:predicted transposase YbfD/YdcC